jgi:hypothetical protein
MDEGRLCKAAKNNTGTSRLRLDKDMCRASSIPERRDNLQLSEASIFEHLKLSPDEE